MPLGNLSEETILKGYSVLKKIQTELNGNKSAAVLDTLSSEFYTTIPHNFGRQNMKQFTINTNDKFKEKVGLVANLQGIA